MRHSSLAHRRLFGGVINETAILIVLLGAVVTLVGVSNDNASLQTVGMDVSGASAILAPVLEVLGLLGKLVAAKKSGEFDSEGPDPLYNEKGYYALRDRLGWSCPWRRRAMSLSKRGKVGSFDNEKAIL